MDNNFLRVNRSIEAAMAANRAPERMAYSMPEVCKALAKSEPVIRGWIKVGRLKGTRSGLDGKSGAWMFSPEAVLAARDWVPVAGVAEQATAAKQAAAATKEIFP